MVLILVTIYGVITEFNLMNLSKLKLYLIKNKWTGGTFSFFEEAIKELGCEVKTFRLPGWDFFRKRFIPTRLLTIDYTRKRLEKYYRKKINSEILKDVLNFKPDIFLVQNESDLLPETVSEIKNSGIITVNLNGDYVFDSTRYQYFPIILKYYDYVFYGEKIWIDNYKRVAPNTKFIKTVGAYNEKYFYPLNKEILDKNSELKADLSFAGSAYGFKAEGHYRVEIINSVADLGLKIWGGDRWDRYFHYYPSLKNCYQGRHLNFEELNILYQNSLINLNISNPQCLTTFQQRTFEMAAAKAFQIADYKEEIYDYFDEDEIVTFKSIDELKDKVRFYLNSSEQRSLIAEKAYKRVISNQHTYRDRFTSYLNEILDNRIL